MKQLFFKSNLLHIRTNEGEYEVSNPEEVPDLIHDKELDIWWLMSPNHSEDPTELTEISRIEWPGGVELIETCKWRGNRDACANEVCWDLEQCQGNPTIKLARLLPKEKKHESAYICPIDKNPCFGSNCIHSDTQPALCGNKKERSESAYKTVSSNTQSCGKFEIKSHYDFEPVESSEPQEKLKKGDAGFKWFTCPTCDGRGSVPQYSAPSESQEEMWNEVNEHINAQIGDYISLEAVKLSFILTRKPE